MRQIYTCNPVHISVFGSPKLLLFVVCVEAVDRGRAWRKNYLDICQAEPFDVEETS